MFQELSDFNKIASQINTRANGFSSEIYQKSRELHETTELYKKMMNDDSTGVQSYSTEELNKVKMRSIELASEIEVAKERLELVRNAEPENLKSMLPDVRNGWKREIKKLNDEIESIFNAAREHRAKLTIEISKCHEKYQKAYKLLYALNEIEGKCGLGYGTGGQTTHVGIPKEPLFEIAVPTGISGLYHEVTDKCVLPSREELTQAYKNGTLPAWVEHYLETGELVTDDDLKPNPVEPKKQTSSNKGNTGTNRRNGRH